MIYDNDAGIRDPFKQDLALDFCRKKTKTTETHTNHGEIHHKRNNWLDPIFFSPGVTQKDCFSSFICVLKVSPRLTLIQKPGLCRLNLLPLMTEFSVFMPFQGIAPGNSWLGRLFLKDHKIIWKIKMRKLKQNNTWRH